MNSCLKPSLNPKPETITDLTENDESKIGPVSVTTASFKNVNFISVLSYYLVQLSYALLTETWFADLVPTNKLL